MVQGIQKSQPIARVVAGVQYTACSSILGSLTTSRTASRARQLLEIHTEEMTSAIGSDNLNEAFELYLDSSHAHVVMTRTSSADAQAHHTVA